MLVVKIELWPKGDEGAAREVGRLHITNDGTGDLVVGNYRAELLKSAEYAKRPGVWRRGRVESFPRRRLGPYDLLFRALRSAVGDRNR